MTEEGSRRKIGFKAGKDKERDVVSSSSILTVLVSSRRLLQSSLPAF